MKEKQTTIIVGGVAGGATVAARLSRLDAHRRIVIIERGEHISFANCGLPYYIGDIIKNRDSLLLATPELFRSRYGIEVMLMHEAVAINKESQILKVRNLATGEVLDMNYDDLVLSPGAAPFRPAMPGVDLPGVMTLRNVPDADKIKEYATRTKAGRAIVIGGGFIGLEVAENLRHLGLDVTVVERGTHVLPPLDSHMALYVERLLKKNGISMEKERMIQGLKQTANHKIKVYTDDWESEEADLIILSTGVRPESMLAREAGLETSASGAIRVNEQMQTSFPGIWAVGDAIEVRSRVTGTPMTLALAGVAQKQARVAANSIMGRDAKFDSVLGTSVLQLFGTSVAMTGMTPDSLARANYPEAWEYLDAHPANHVTYYPGATPIHMRLVYRKKDGLILGATAIGEQDAARKIDVIAAVMNSGGTVEDLAELELCYSPQEGAAKDAVNIVGMAATNNLDGLCPIAHLEEIGAPGTFLLDVREEEETLAMPYPDSYKIPLSQLRERWRELPLDKTIHVFCHAGVRAYNAVRFLNNNGLDARNISGGYLSMSLL